MNIKTNLTADLFNMVGFEPVDKVAAAAALQEHLAAKAGPTSEFTQKQAPKRYSKRAGWHSLSDLDVPGRRHRRHRLESRAGSTTARASSAWPGCCALSRISCFVSSRR